MGKTIIWFFAFLAIGAVVVILLMAFWIRPLCSAESENFYALQIQQLQPVRTEERAKRSAQQTRAPNENKKSTKESTAPTEIFKAKIEQKKAEEIQEGKNWYEYGWWKKFLCELKIGDVAIGFFTYCLVVVGAFTMWVVDKTAKRTERAYIVCGGPFGKRKKKAGFLKRFFQEKEDQPQFFNSAQNFTYPWRMAIHNYGKTTAFITEIKWGFCRYEDFIKINDKVVVSKLIENPHKWLPKYVEIEKAENADEAIPPDLIGIPYRHVPVDRDRYIGWVFFGRVRYKDVFGDSHYSTFKLQITEHHSDPLPGCHSEST